MYTRTFRASSILTTIAICLGLAACSSDAPKPAETPAAAPAAAPQGSMTGQTAQRYDLKGKVVAMDKAGRKLTVDAGDIPGFMSAMTMPYPVKDDHLLDNLAVGDQITAKVVSSGGDFWLENIATVKPEAPAR
jgi:protein SCO1/2